MRKILITIFTLGQLCSLSFAKDVKSNSRAPDDVSAKANLELGKRYEDGEGVSRDFAKARELFCEAAQSGMPEAYFQLGWMYLNGRGVLRDDAVGVYWLRKAAHQGISQATNVLRLVSAPSAVTAKSSCASLGGQVHASKEMQALVTAKAHEARIDPRIVMAVISAESGFDPMAVSPKNARGLMQLTSDTAQRFGVSDPFNVNENLRGGIGFLIYLMGRFHGDLGLVLAGYNAGEHAVDEWGGIPPYEETINYVNRVKSICACFSATDLEPQGKGQSPRR